MRMIDNSNDGLASGQVIIRTSTPLKKVCWALGVSIW